MRSFEELVTEADTVDVSGWDFGWLDGRATEERPPWGYARLLAGRLAETSSALDVDTGGGEILAGMPTLPHRMCVTESWPPNARRARKRLTPRGVEVRETAEGAPIPFEDGSFDLVTSRHPVHPDWTEIHRVLAPGGHYFAQHVGPHSVYELIEYFVGPLPRERAGRDPEAERDAATAAGLDVTGLETARCRIEVFDIGAVVYLLRKCVWWLPDFSVARYEHRLRDLDAQLRGQRPFVTYSTRHLIEAVKKP